MRQLCQSGMAGLSFALALFGPEVSAPMVALYVGGSIFGNIWAVSAVSPDARTLGIGREKSGFVAAGSCAAAGRYFPVAGPARSAGASLD